MIPALRNELGINESAALQGITKIVAGFVEQFCKILAENMHSSRHLEAAHHDDQSLPFVVWDSLLPLHDHCMCHLQLGCGGIVRVLEHERADAASKRHQLAA